MEEELLKRNTDCVYFLASPLTCKKGAECEYRHSDMARLNPRDCWYWLSGSCLNPTCAFRHPPLENPTEVPSESDLVPSQATQPPNKNAVPCYFYFQGYCSKGDTCTFLHSPHGSMSTAKSVKAPSTNSDGHAVNSSQASGNKSALVATEVQKNLSATAQKPSVDLKLPDMVEVQQLDPDVVVQKSSPRQIAETDNEEACVYETDTLLPPESYNENRSYMGADLNSEDHVEEDHIEPEEPWESSPGFDVLVDNEEEGLCYKDEQDFMVALDQEQRVLDNQFGEYNFEEPDVHLGFNQSREVDLREHLRKRRAVDGEQYSRSTRRRKSSPLYEPLHLHNGRAYKDGLREQNRRSHERPYKHGVSRRIRESHNRQYEHGLSERLRGRLECDVGRTGIEFANGYGIRGNCASEELGWMMHSPFDRPILHDERRESRRPYVPPSEFRGRPVRRERLPSEEGCGEFSRPKSLAQIRDEKRRCEQNGYNIERDGDMSGSATNFEGPKPLNEILKEKKKLVEV